LSIEKAQKDFGYNPTTDLNEGLVIYYNWLLNSTYWQEQFNPKPKPQDVIKVTPIKVTPPAKKKSKAKPKAK
jgi:hypothetical protein